PFGGMWWEPGQDSLAQHSYDVLFTAPQAAALPPSRKVPSIVPRLMLQGKLKAAVRWPPEVFERKVLGPCDFVEVKDSEGK
uniref:Uncharacterized protein n=1 Tax=Amphimedon queenslandica TaxID=400682 RepID=A0A1X7T7U6_AMPQE